MYDVAVVGGGPVGSRVAYQLAGKEHRVIVADRKERLDEPVCCTGIVSRECVNHFGIDNSLIAREAASARVFSHSGKLLSLKRPEPQACVLDRPAFNEALARLAQARGAEYLLGRPVTNIAVQNDRVRIELGRRAEEGSEFLEAKAAVVAAGSGSKLAEALGLGKAGDFAMGVQATVETTGLDEVEVYLGHKIAPAFFAWLVPVSRRQALVGLMARHRASYYLKELVSSLTAQGKIVSSKAEPSYAVVPLKPLARTYADRIIVVGSAAGQVKPITGGGIYYGLLCADIAADSLDAALESGNLSAKSLSGYEKAWQKKLGHEIKVGYWGRKFYEMLSDRRIDSIFDIIKSNGIDRALLEATDVSFDWHSRAVLKLFGHRALHRIVETLKLPLPSGR